jgi:uncharacterized SAM-binding protein YcdF (DUF218 family)
VRSRSVRSLALAVILLLVLFLTRAVWLPVFGYALIHNDGPAKADIAVVPAGDSYGHRILKAAELVRAGYVPQVLVSGPGGLYETHETDLAIPFVVRRGYPAEWFIALPNSSHSTTEEATAIIGELKRRQIHSFLLVTSTFHSGRATRTYRALLNGAAQFRTVTSEDEYFHADSWWKTRESRKTVLSEWMKSVAAVLGI